MLYFKKKLLFLLLCIAMSVSAFTQPANDVFKKIPPQLLRQDFAVLKDTLQKIHAGLYRYRSKPEINRIFDSCLASIVDTMSISDFYALASHALAAIEDGHTNCRLPKAVMNDYMNNVKVFPAMVMFMHNKAFVWCCKQHDELAESELLSIDNHSLDEIIQRLFCYICSDAGIQSRKNWEMPESFQLLYNILYGAKDSFDVKYKTMTGDIKTTTVYADFIRNILCAGPFPTPDKYLELNYKPGNVAVLTLKTFFNGFLQRTNENFSRFLDSSFKDIRDKKVEKLVIDVRSNQGGNDVNGEMLYSYLTQKPFMYYASQETVTRKFSEADNPDLKLQQPKENNFKGKVYILINGRSFSGTAEFSSVARSNNRGVFIGEECGGGYYGNTSGNETMVTLPNTQITARIPMVKYTMAVKKAPFKDGGVMPDYPVYPTISDLVGHKDVQMEYALKLAGKN